MILRLLCHLQSSGPQHNLPEHVHNCHQPGNTIRFVSRMTKCICDEKAEFTLRTSRFTKSPGESSMDSALCSCPWKQSGSDIGRQWTRTFILLHDQSGRGTTAEGAFKSRGQPDKKAKHILLGESPDYRACDLVASRHRVIRLWLALCLYACYARWKLV
jgi:hypothetical protein